MTCRRKVCLGTFCYAKNNMPETAWFIENRKFFLRVLEAGDVPECSAHIWPSEGLLALSSQSKLWKSNLATCAPWSISHKNYKFINKEGRSPADLIISSKRPPPPLNPFTISTPGLWRGLTFNMNSGRDLSFSGTSSCLYKAYCKKVLTYLKVTRSGSLCLYPNVSFYSLCSESSALL